MSYQGETVAIVLVGVFLGLLVLTLGIRVCYVMIRKPDHVEVNQIVVLHGC